MPLPWEKYGPAPQATPAPPGPWANYATPSPTPTPAPEENLSKSVPTGDWMTKAEETTLPSGRVSRITSPSTLAEIISSGKHGAGVSARNALEAVGSIPSLALTGIRAIMPKASYGDFSDVAPPERNLAALISGAPAPQEAPPPAPIDLGGMLSDAMGLDKPEGNFENQVSAIQQGATSAAMFPGAGKLVEGSLPRVGKFLMTKPGLQMVAGATGADAAELAKEAGWTPGAQLAASLAGGIAPSLPGMATNGLKSIVQGGRKGAETIAENLANFTGAGASPTVGQVTGQGNLQAIEGGILANSPGSGGIIHRAAVKQQGDIGSRIDDIAATLDPKKSDQMQVGRTIKSGIEDSFVSNAKDAQQRLYAALDMHIDPLAEVAATNTTSTIQRLTAPIPGAEAISKSSLLSNPTLDAAGSALKKDMAGTPDTLSTILGADGKPFVIPGDPAKGTMPYEALKELRSRIGNKLSDFQLTSDVPRAQLKQLYGALSADMEAAAKAAGPDAYKAFQRANNYTRSMHGRMEVLQGVIDRAGGPEQIYNAALSGNRDGATTIRAVMQALPPDGQKTLGASILRRMGRATDGNQNADSSIFSTETFLTNVSKMSDAAKSAVFDRFGPTFAKDMSQVLKVAENLRFGSKVYKNPSGTAQAISNRSTAGAALLSLLTGHVGTAAAIGGVVGTANIGARVFTSPKVVKWLASASRRPVEAIPALVNQLALQSKQGGDPDAAEVANYLKEHLANPQSSDTH